MSELNILLPLVSSQPCCRLTRLDRSGCHICCCKSVSHRHIPREALTLFPGNESKAVWAHFTVPHEVFRLSAGRDGRALKGSPDQIIDLLVAGKTASAESTWETMGAHVVDPCTAVAGMCGADGCAESQTNCYAYRFVVEAQPARRDWQRV